MFAATKLATAAFTVAAAVVLNNAVEQIVAVAAGLTAVTIIWRNFLRPLGGILKHGAAIVRKAAAAMDSLEHLPARWEEQEKRDREKDERISSVEAEVGIVHNDVAAIRRKLGVTDDEVRSPA